MSWLSNYISGPTHKWWVEKVWRPSWTRFVSMIYGIPALLVAGMQEVSVFANDSTISGYLAQLNVPNWVPMALAGIALVHYVAHGRD